MRRGIWTLLLSLNISASASIYSSTLEEVVSRTLQNNPIIQERLHNYKATRADLRRAEAGYYPKLDLELGIGKSYRGRFSSAARKSYSIFHSALKMRQNIFKGFATNERVNYQMMRSLAAAYSYLEKANDVTLQTIKAYINLIRYKELLQNARKYVNDIKALNKKITKSYKAGLVKMSAVSRVRSSLSSAKANMLVARNRLANALYKFRRVTGFDISLKKLKRPRFNIPLPKDQKRAAMYALEYNPSLIVERYNIKGAEALYRVSKSKFYPRIDAEISANYDDDLDTRRNYPDKQDEIRAMLMLRYNIYNGGADEAARLNKLSKVSQEMSVLRDLRRQVMQGMDLSWSTYRLEKEHIPFLRRYKRAAQKTLELYWKEFSLGERSLLDILAVHKDIKGADDELINAKYNLLIAKYRILDAMGLTIASVSGDVKRYYKKVGLFNRGRFKADRLPVSNDQDRDAIADDKDLEPVSKPSRRGVRPYGSSRALDALKTIRGAE